MSTLYSPVHPLFFVLFALIFTGVIVVLFLGVVGAALREIGFGTIGAALVIGSSLLGSYLNIPIVRVPAEHREITEEYVRVFGILYRVPRITDTVGSTVIAINVGGALIPALVSMYVLYRYASGDSGHSDCSCRDAFGG